MGLVILEPPGFVDLPDALLASTSPATGFVLSALKDNAAVGCVIPEIFTTTQKDGDTVPLPISPVDGYQYLREELVYVWEVANTTNNASPVPSAQGGIWWAEWFVEPDTGKVHCVTMYVIENQIGNCARTSDGQLTVWSFGIRGRQLRSMSAIAPVFTDIAATAFPQDGAADQFNLQNLSHNAKLGTVACEIVPVNPSNAPLWQPSTNYNEGDLVQPTGRRANGFWYIAATSGLSAAIEPNWPGVWQSPVPITDNQVIWNVAGAGFTNGEEIMSPPPSPIDGYVYGTNDTIIPFLSFISTQAVPFQKANSRLGGNYVNLTSAGPNDVRVLNKSITATQPTPPVTGGGGGGGGGKYPPPLIGISGDTNTYSSWAPSMADWLTAIGAPAAPTLGYTAGGTLGATTYYVKITYTLPGGESAASLEVSIAVPANNLLTVNTPAADSQGRATGYNVYVGTASGAETLQNASPIPLAFGSDAYIQENTPITTTGAKPPTIDSTGFVAAAAEIHKRRPLPRAGTPAQFGIGIVNCSVKYGHSLFNDGTVMVWLLCFRNSKVSAMAAPGGALFTDMSTDAFLSGEPLREDYMQDLNENTKFSILRPEIFVYPNIGPTQIDAGTAVPVPTSPIDGYVYSRGELTYMWWFQTTGLDSDRMRDFAMFVDPQTGIVNGRTDYYRETDSSLGTIIYGTGGVAYAHNLAVTNSGIPTLTVIVVARRSHENELQTTVIISGGGNQPAPPGTSNLIPNGGFEIWSIPTAGGIVFIGVADDWGIGQSSGPVNFEQVGVPYALKGKYSQGIGTLPAANTLAHREQIIGGTYTPPHGQAIASIDSEIVPVWPGGTYRYHFLAASYRAVHTGGDGVGSGHIAYGFYARCHVLGADVSGAPDPTTDTTFEFLGNIGVQPGLNTNQNPGAALSSTPPAFNSFDFTFTVPQNGDGYVLTSVGRSVLSQNMPVIPAYVYFEFLCWDTICDTQSTSRMLWAVIDDVNLQDLTEGSTTSNQQGSQVAAADNAAFSYGSTSTSLSFWWGAVPVPFLNGVIVSAPAQGSSGSPAQSFTGLSPSTNYYLSTRYNQMTGAIEWFNRTTPAGSDTTFLAQTLNADGYVPIFVDWEIATPASGSGGGGGSGGGSRCFTGETCVLTSKGLKKFADLPPVVVIVNDSGMHGADVIVHEDSLEELIVFHDGGVTPKHLVRKGIGDHPAGDVFAIQARAPAKRQTLYNLHIRGANPKDQYFYVRLGGELRCVHNWKTL